MTLTAQERKERPLARGVLDYFPDALMEVAHTSYIGNEQHNPGQPLHWAKEKSTDEADALLRHLKDRGTIDTDGVRHTAKVAWRALAMLQREIEAERALIDEANTALGDEVQYTQPMTAAEMIRELAAEAGIENIEQMLVDDSAARLEAQLNANINSLTDYHAAEVNIRVHPINDFPWTPLDTEVTDHGADNGELPQPHGSRPSHYEGDFGVIRD